MASEGLWFDALTGAPSYNARQLRRLQSVFMAGYRSDPLAARQGKHPSTGNCISVTGASTTTPTVVVAAGKGMVNPAFNLGDGSYPVVWDGTSFPVVRPTTNPRIDRVVSKVEDDPIDASLQRRVTIVYKVGTPGAIPVAPVVDQNEMDLGTVAVPVGTGTVLADNAKVYTVGAGGILPDADFASHPTTNVLEGSYADSAAAESLDRYNGAAWEKMVTPLKSVNASGLGLAGWTMTMTAWHWGPLAWGRLDIARTGTTITLDSGGGMADADVGTLPVGTRPITTAYGTLGDGTTGPHECNMTSAGLVNIRSGIPAALLTSGRTLRYTFIFIRNDW